MSCDTKYKCPVCGDRLIHQLNRGMNESSSAIGQHIHDVFPSEFWFMDVDFMIYKRATRIFRFIEHKRLEGALSKGQQFFLPFLAVCIRLGVIFGLLHSQSGVFILTADPPFKEGGIQKLGASLTQVLGLEYQLNEEMLNLFLTCFPLPGELGEIK